MPNYKRVYIPGGTFFFTVVTYDRRPILTDPISRRLLRQSWLLEKRCRPFDLEAICLMPDYIHFIFRLPEQDSDYSTRISGMKARFTKSFLENKNGYNGMYITKLGKGERTVWQHRFWEHMIRDEDDFRRHVDYIHYNPVKHGLVSNVKDWPWSSFHRYVRDGIYTSDWGSDFIAKDDCSLGE
jgi:putative transposase